MPSAYRFVVKDSPDEIKEIIEKKNKNKKKKIQGRTYTTKYAKQPGGIKASELSLGIQFACISITDDEIDTLKNVGKLNPWQITAMEMMLNNNNKNNINIHAPLSTILLQQYGLYVDHMINVSGISRAGHALDTQGFIAHNDEIIVLSYRCTTSIADWVTNLTTTSSAWQIRYDVKQGHSGYMSCWEDHVCCGYTLCTGYNSKDYNNDNFSSGTPRVHTGFYNNFLVTVPLIEKYIDPLLFDKSKSRTLYVCGHSLGGGIATMAACYFILEEEKYNWINSNNKLRIVTAGSPRSCGKKMQKLVDTKLQVLRETVPDQVILARVVRDKDTVPTVPPTVFNFVHLQQTKLVYITKEDDFGLSTILINPNIKNNIISKRTIRYLIKKNPKLFHKQGLYCLETNNNEEDDEEDDDDNNVNVQDNDDDNEEENNGQQQRDDDIQNTSTCCGNVTTNSTISYYKVPKALRDHMPEFYIKPLMDLAKYEALLEYDNDDKGNFFDETEDVTSSSDEDNVHELYEYHALTNSNIEIIPNNSSSSSSSSVEEEEEKPKKSLFWNRNNNNKSFVIRRIQPNNYNNNNKQRTRTTIPLAKQEES